MTTGQRSLSLRYMTRVAVHGGYVYWVSPDKQQRYGEGPATASEIWVEPPGTPTVGQAFLNAWTATKDDIHFEAAMNAAKALIYGQLVSGGWNDRVDFDSQGKNANRYRNGQGNQKGNNYSTLDDDKTQSALRFLMALDRRLEFKNELIHESALFGLEALLKAQFPNGGFPQGWNHSTEQIRSEMPTALQASFPEYEWRTEGKHKNYWDYPTLNDGLAGTISKTLVQASETYGDNLYIDSLRKLGDFLIISHMPDPQPAWAQQYNFKMQPMWARKLEPPAIVGRESEDAIDTLLYIHRITNDSKYLAPIPKALDWLKNSQLPDGRIARFYELKTNRPLYLIKDDY